MLDVVSYDMKDPYSNEFFKVYMTSKVDGAFAVVEDVDSNMFWMVKQFRFGINDSMFEFAGGKIDSGEDPYAAISREVGEELGLKLGINFSTEDIKLMSASWSTPSMTPSKAYLFYIPVHGMPRKTDFDAHEHIEALLLPKYQVQKLMSSTNVSMSSLLAWTQYLMQVASNI